MMDFSKLEPRKQHPCSPGWPPDVFEAAVDALVRMLRAELERERAAAAASSTATVPPESTPTPPRTRRQGAKNV